MSLTSILTKDLSSIAHGLNIEGCNPSFLLPKSCVWYNVIQAIDQPLEGFTFDDVMYKKSVNKFDLIEQSIDCINIDKFIDDLVNLIDKIKLNHKKLLVHVHQKTGTTTLDKILQEKTGVNVILDEIDFFVTPVNYAEKYPDIDGLLSISQCAGLYAKAGEWVVPSLFFNFDVNKNIITLNSPQFNNAIKKYIDFPFVEGPILVVNGLWNPTSDDLEKPVFLKCG